MKVTSDHTWILKSSLFDCRDKVYLQPQTNAPTKFVDDFTKEIANQWILGVQSLYCCLLASDISIGRLLY